MGRRIGEHDRPATVDGRVVADDGRVMTDPTTQPRLARRHVPCRSSCGPLRQFVDMGVPRKARRPTAFAAVA